MKNLRIRLLPLALAFGLLSCQDRSATSSTESGQLQIQARLFAANGGSIPAADTVHFSVVIGGRSVDTAVAWSQHGLDLGPVAVGTKIHWQASAWKWDSTKTKRTVVWASQSKDTVASAEANTMAFTLQTPVLATTFVPPVAIPGSFTADSTGMIVIPVSPDSSFVFTFTAPAGIGLVKINDTVVSPVSGTTYSKVLSVPSGTSRPVTVFLQDTIGDASIKTYVVTRNGSTSVDSSIILDFVSPSVDTTIGNSTTSVGVSIKTSSSIRVDSVKIGSVFLIKGSDTTKWTGTVTGLAVGADTLRAAAYYHGRIQGQASIVVTRNRPTSVVDSSISLDFVSPSFDTSVPNATTSVGVVLKSTSVRHVDSVKIGSLKLIRGLDTTRWTGTVTGLAVGSDSLIAFAYAGATRVGTSIVVRRQPAGSVDSTVAVSFVVPGRDTVVGNATTSVAVSVKTSSVLRVDSVKIGSAYLTKGSDSTKWTGTVTGLAVGSDTLRAVAYILGRSRGQASTVVTRQGPAKRDLTLSWLGISDLVPAFSSKVTNYTVTWDANVSGGGGGYTATDSTVSVSAAGATCVNKYCSFTLGAAGSATPIEIKLADGVDTLRYKVTIYRRPVSPTFSPVGGAVPKNQQVTISATAADTIQISGDSATWSKYTTPVVVTATTKLYARSIKGGVVSAVTTANYTVASTVAHDTTLYSLSIGSIGFTQAFQASRLSYTTDSLASNYVGVTVYAAPNDANATVTYNGSSSGIITLTGTSTPVSVVVTNGTSTLTYTINILMKQEPVGPDASLEWLGFSSLSPAFSSNLYSYTAAMTNGSGGQCYPTDANATIAVTNADYAVIGGKGYCSPKLSTLSMGQSTVVTITVTNGSSQKTYSVTVTRQ